MAFQIQSTPGAASKVVGRTKPILLRNSTESRKVTWQCWCFVKARWRSLWLLQCWQARWVFTMWRLQKLQKGWRAVGKVHKWSWLCCSTDNSASDIAIGWKVITWRLPKLKTKRPNFWWLDKEKPAHPKLRLMDPAMRFYYSCIQQFRMVKGVLYYEWLDDFGFRSLRLFAPRSLRRKIIEGCDDPPSSGHQGEKKTLERVKRSFYSHCLTADVLHYVATCAMCGAS